MGIDIEQIAMNVDKGNLGNKNGVVLDTADERIEFVKQAKNAGATDDEIRNYFQGINIAPEEVNKALGVELSLTGSNVSENSAKFVESRSNADKKDDRKFALKELSAVGSSYAKAEPINWDALANDLTLRVQKQNPYIKQNLMTQIKTVINSFKEQNYDSKESIEKAYRAAKDSLPKGENNDFMQDVLKVVANIADAHQKEVEKAEILKEYNNLRNEQKLSREESVKTLKKHFKSKGSFYSEIIKEVEENVIMKEAHDEVWDAINRQRIGQVGADGKVVTAENALTNKTDIQKAIKKDPNLTRDKYTNKVMKGSSELSASEKVNFERSTYKANRASAASDNRVAINREKPFTEKDFKKSLKHDQIFNVLVQKGWIEETGQQDGQPAYTLKKLSDELGRKVGAETAGSPQKREYIAYSELERILLSVLAEGGEHTDVKMSKSDVIGLLKLCGYDYDGTSFIKKLWQETGGALADAAIGAATALAVGVSSTAEYAGNRGPFKISLPYSDEVPVTVDVINNTHIKMTFTSNNQYASFNKFQFLKDLMRENGLTSDDVSLENLENGFSVIVNKNSANTVEFMKKISGMAEGEVLPEDLGIDFDNIDKQTDKDYTKSLVVGLLLTLGLMALRAALRQSGELPVEVTQFETKDFNKYKEELNIRVDRGTLKPDQRDALIQIAGVYNKDGKWDSERYKAMLNKIAGDGSFLNKFELAIGADKILRGIIKDDEVQNTTPVTNKDNDDAQDVNGTKYTKKDDDSNSADNVGVILNAGRFGWRNLGRMYKNSDGKSCFDDSNPFRAMQVIQAIDPDAVNGRYDADVIKEIVAKAFPRGNGKPEWSYINNQLKDEYPQVDVVRLKAVLASPVSADETKDKKVVAPLVIFDKNGEYNRGEPEREAPVKQSSRGTGKGNSKRFNVVTGFTKVIDGVTHYYLKPPGGAAYEVDRATYNASSFKEES